MLPFFFLLIPIIHFFLRLFYKEASIFMIPDFGESDVLHLNLPLKDVLSNSLKNGEWPLWTPLLAGGFPLLAEGQIGTFYLPNLLLFRFLPTVLAYNLSQVLSFVFIAFGTYLFAREFNFSKITSSIASFIFTFSGFFSVHLNHLNLIQTASLTPFAYWSALILWKKPSLSKAVLFSFILSQQIFAGYLTILFVSMVGIFMFYLILKSAFKKWFYFLISILIACLFSAIQLLPTFEIWRLSERSGGLEFTTVTSYPYPPIHLLTFLNPYFFGSPASGTYEAFNSNWGIFWENTAYLGILPLILALASLFFYSNRRVFTLFFLTAFSILMVLGKYSPLYFIFSFPPFNLFRVPSRYLLITAWSITLLASISLEKILKFKYRFVILAIVGLVIFIDEYRFSYNYPPITPASWWMEKPETVKKIETLGYAKVASIGAPETWNNVFLKNGWQDMHAYKSFANSLYPNQNLLFQLPQVDVNTGGLIPRRLNLFTQLANDFEIDSEKNIATLSAISKNIMGIANVSYFISPNIIDPKTASLVFQVPPYNIYKNEKALPRSYIAYKTKGVETTQDIIRELSQDDYPKTFTVLVETDLMEFEYSNSAFFGPVDIISSKPQEVILEAKTKKSGILVLADTYYPGWHTSIDGKKAEIFPVNLNQRGILIAEGRHKVRFWYDSKYFSTGKLITIISSIIAALVMFLRSFSSYRKVLGSKKLSLHP